MSEVSRAFAAAQAINADELRAYPTSILKRALGLAKGIARRTENGGYDQVRHVIEEVLRERTTP